MEPIESRSDIRSKLIAATPAEVFAALRDPARVARWWGPAGFTNTIHTYEFVPGGRWLLTMHGPDGKDHPNESRFTRIVEDRLVEIEHLDGHHFVLALELHPHAQGTTVAWRQTFDTAAHYEQLADFVAAANEQNLERLAAEVASASHRFPDAAARRLPMKTLTFETTIAAPRPRVWDAMLGPETYKAWTSAFCEGSYYTGSWEPGASIRFLAPSGDGITSVIAENRRHEFVSIRHLGVIENGVEDTTSEKVRAWAPSYENYAFADVPGGCRVTVTVDVRPEDEPAMQDKFPKALGLLKALCER